MFNFHNVFFKTKLLSEIPIALVVHLKLVMTALFLTWMPFVQLANAETQPPTNWEAYDAQAQALAPTVSLLAAEITHGMCQPIHSLYGELNTPIGSSFKLYILAEIASQIRQSRFIKPREINEYQRYPRRRLTWDMPIIIEQKYKSIPGGPLLYVPDGSIYTLRYFAEQMIQLSDNTATDHLLFLAGRKNVERRMELSGHHDPALNTPLFATREFAIIKFLWSDEQLQEYEQASMEERRELLAAEQRGWPELETFFEKNGDQIEPVRAERLEWFANRLDMCKLMAIIHQMGQSPRLRPLLEVISLQDPIDFDREKWTYVGYKGGSEIGVQSGNWLVQRNDGRLFFFSAAFLDPYQPLDLANIIPLLKATPDILFETP